MYCRKVLTQLIPLNYLELSFNNNVAPFVQLLMIFDVSSLGTRRGIFCSTIFYLNQQCKLNKYSNNTKSKTNVVILIRSLIENGQRKNSKMKRNIEHINWYKKSRKAANFIAYTAIVAVL